MKYNQDRENYVCVCVCVYEYNLLLILNSFILSFPTTTTTKI